MKCWQRRVLSDDSAHAEPARQGWDFPGHAARCHAARTLDRLTIGTFVGQSLCAFHGGAQQGGQILSPPSPGHASRFCPEACVRLRDRGQCVDPLCAIIHPVIKKKRHKLAKSIACTVLQKFVNNNIPGALASSMHMLPCCSSGQNLTPYWLPVRPAFNSSFYGVCALRADSGAI
jgi:hypothetical protein